MITMLTHLRKMKISSSFELLCVVCMFLSNSYKALEFPMKHCRYIISCKLMLENRDHFWRFYRASAMTVRPRLVQRGAFYCEAVRNAMGFERSIAGPPPGYEGCKNFIDLRLDDWDAFSVPNLSLKKYSVVLFGILLFLLCNFAIYLFSIWSFYNF